ncbi:MAG: hypothetical protein KDB57_04615 [Solirubrobacterales bacterium]|nr:hypothetical protein [Solirubrobacterales bacterium]
MDESVGLGRTEPRDKPAGQSRLAEALAWLIGLVAVSALVGYWSLNGPAPSPLETLVVSMIVVLPVVCGLLLVRAQTGNAVGWLLLAEGLVMALMALSDQPSHDAIEQGSSATFAEQLAVLCSQSLWPLMFAGFAGIAYVFPDGGFFNRKYRRWGLAGAGAVTVFLAFELFAPSGFEPPYQDVPSPLAVAPFAAPDVILWMLLLTGLASLFAAAFAVRARLKASTGDRRLQMLWLAWAAIWIPATLFLCLLDGIVFGAGGGEGLLTQIALLLMATMMPLAIGIGILRYRLFDIEVVISRTLVYGTLSLIVAAVYAAIVAAFAALFGSATAAGVLGAGAVAVMVQPVHARLQRRVDRWIFGDRSDPYAALQRLDDRLKETQAPEEAVQAVVESVAESLRLPWSAVEFDRDGEGMTIAAYGARGGGTLERRELWHRGEHVGSLVVEVPKARPLSESDRRLLDQLAGHVGAAVQSVRLTIDLLASRKELVTAREEERRRLRRDLHDGVGPSLAAMSLQLEVLRERVSEEDEALVDQLGAQAQEAIVDIRRLVYELRPPALDQYGLVSGLSEQARRMSSEATAFSVRAPEEMPALPAAIEVAVYRIALEAMTNAARHSGASSCEVNISVEGPVSLTVEDDGVGIDTTAAHGVGLRSMRERTDELGGAFAVGVRNSGGTTLRAEFPLEET